MDTVDASQAGDTSATRKMAVMDIRVKEVPDLSTFWAQIGTRKKAVVVLCFIFLHISYFFM